MKGRSLLATAGLALLATACRARSETKTTGAPSAAPRAVGAAPGVREPLGRSAAPRAVGAAPGVREPLGRIGGALVRGQSYSAELLVFGTGRAEVALSDAAAHALNEPLAVTLELATRGAGRITLPLRYSPQRERFQGIFPPGTELVSDRALLKLEHNERRDELSVPRVTLLRGPEHGGHVFNVGELGVELFVEASGRIQAYVGDRAGVPLAEPTLRLEATLLTQALEKERVALAWDAPSGTYRGAATGKLRPGPMELSTQSSRARLQQGGLAPEAARGGRVLLVGFHAVELLLRRDEAELFVYDAFGKPYPKGHLELVLAFETQPHADLYRTTWDEKNSCYRATLRPSHAGAAALSVALTAGEHTDFGAVTLR